VNEKAGNGERMAERGKKLLERKEQPSWGSNPGPPHD